jgi:hypothetical protein
VNGAIHVVRVRQRHDAKAQVSGGSARVRVARHRGSLGDVTASRGMEMYLPIWLRMWARSGRVFNVKLVR